MRQQARWSWIWGAWTTAVVGSFAVLESLALTRRTHPTYSDTLSRWLGCQPVARRRPLAVTALAAGEAWLVLHLWRYRERV